MNRSAAVEAERDIIASFDPQTQEQACERERPLRQVAAATIGAAASARASATGRSSRSANTTPPGKIAPPRGVDASRATCCASTSMR
ncbi:MAG: hypothetical protein U0232_00130 [Thermomicrobiales bacterium]